MATLKLKRKPLAVTGDTQSPFDKSAAVRDRLRAWRPDLFGSPTPLALGIDKKLLTEQRRTVNSRELRTYLYKLVRSREYLLALIEPGSQRLDADGSLTPVNDEARAIAIKRLASLRS